jgi:preprotein translocase SecF subunit
MLSVFKNPNYDFLKMRKTAFIISGVLIFSGIVSIFVRGGLNYGVDFTGGYILEAQLEGEPVSSEEMRTALSKVGFEKAMIQKYREGDLFLIKVKESEENPLEELKAALKENFSDRKIEFPRQELVGPAISRGLQTRAAWVILLGMIGILIYVSIRFTFRFGVAAIVALVHDLVLTTGILSITNTEFSIPIIAGLLTILGYSINDSIVISDRIRENIKLMRGKPFDEIINSSINQTLARTIITSLTTLFVLISLFFLGGRILHGFSLTLLVGVLIGTYSSIFIVAPIVAEWEKKYPSRKR